MEFFRKRRTGRNGQKAKNPLSPPGAVATSRYQRITSGARSMGQHRSGVIRMHGELISHHASCRLPADGPKQIGVLLFTRGDESAISQNQIG